MQGNRESYRSLIKTVLASGYTFMTMMDDDYGHEELAFRMRHDVDISPYMALGLSEEEANLGIKSSYYFQLNADTYSCLSKATVNAINEIRNAGHCVGLHIDQDLFGESERSVQETLSWFNDNVTSIDNSCSFHRPSPNVLGKAYSSFRSAYDPRWYSPSRYLSDSKRNFAFVNRLDQMLKSRTPGIQLLTHPEWWGGHLSPSDVFESLLSRRQVELVDYVKSNFPSVFKEVSDAEYRNPRV